MSRALGLILTITGLILGWTVVQMMLAPGPAPLPVFIISPIAIAMLSVGVRYILRRPNKQNKKEGSTS